MSGSVEVAVHLAKHLGSGTILGKLQTVRLVDSRQAHCSQDMGSAGADRGNSDHLRL